MIFTRCSLPQIQTPPQRFIFSTQFGQPICQKTLPVQSQRQLFVLQLLGVDHVALALQPVFRKLAVPASDTTQPGQDRLVILLPQGDHLPQIHCPVPGAAGSFVLVVSVPFAIAIRIFI